MELRFRLQPPPPAFKPGSESLLFALKNTDFAEKTGRRFQRKRFFKHFKTLLRSVDTEAEALDAFSSLVPFNLRRESSEPTSQDVCDAILQWLAVDAQVTVCVLVKGEASIKKVLFTPNRKPGSHFRCTPAQTMYLAQIVSPDRNGAPLYCAVDIGATAAGEAQTCGQAERLGQTGEHAHTHTNTPHTHTHTHTAT